MRDDQFSLFERPSILPEGLEYQADLLSRQEESRLANLLSELPFAPFEFHGFLGKRRIVSFGWRYGFDGSGLSRSEPIPDFLLPLRGIAAGFAGLETEALEHVLVTEYAPGAGIGWHKDRSVFGETVGVSLLSPCRLRFRRRGPDGWDRANLLAEARSAYILRGEARSSWEHSIAPLETLRYSVTFRTLL